MLEILSYSVCKLYHKIQLQINTGFTVTGWMLYVISHICKDVKNNSDSDYRKQVNNAIKKRFHGASQNDMAVTQDIF